MDQHNFLLKNGDVLIGPLKIETDKIVNDLDLTNKEYVDKHLLKYGDTIDDAVTNVDYKWNKPVSFETTKDGAVELKAGGAYVKVNKDDGEDDVIIYGADTASLRSKWGTTVSSEWKLTVDAQKEITINSDTGNVNIIAGNDSAEVVYRNIDETSDPKQITNKEYVDDRDDLLRQDIIELEEQIDAIAPSLEYGSWKYEEPAAGNATRPPASGTFFLVDELGAVTHEYEETAIIKIHNDEFVAPGDTDPVDNHTWADADVGELIQLFDAADPDFFLGKITGKNVDPASESVTFTVDRVQSSGVPNDNADPVTGEFLTRVNIFKEPSGGTASDFVLKAGDTMTGRLVMESQEELVDFTVPTGNDARIEFKNIKPDGSQPKSSILYKPGNVTSLACDSQFYAPFLFTNEHVYGYYDKTENDGRVTRVTKFPTISFFSRYQQP